MEKETGIPNLTTNDLLSLISESRDPREAAYTKLVDHLWDKSKLKMISRINNEMYIYSVKNLVVISFFQKYWCKAKAKIKLVKTDEPPYYKRVIDYVYPYSNGVAAPEYYGLMEDVWELSISLQGKGRAEILKLIQKSSDELDIKDRLRNTLGGV